MTNSMQKAHVTLQSQSGLIHCENMQKFINNNLFIKNYRLNFIIYFF
jgi:hypothetical protein